MLTGASFLAAQTAYKTLQFRFQYLLFLEQNRGNYLSLLQSQILNSERV